MSHARSEVPGYRVLIVDESEDIHATYRASLEQPPSAKDKGNPGTGHPARAQTVNDERPRHGLPVYRIDSTFRGDEAMAMVERAVRSQEPYALAFVHLGMPPQWHGITTIERIWQLDPGVQVVASTASSEPSWYEVIARMGASERLFLVHRPCDASAVRQLAQTLAHRWHAARDARLHIARLEANLAERTGELATVRAALRERERATPGGANLMAARSRFLANMSHELRTPLNGVLGAAQLLSEDGTLDHSQERLVALVRRSGQSLLTVINDLLDISRIEAGTLRMVEAPFDLRTSVDHVVASMAPRARPTIEVAARVAADVPDTLCGDEFRFEQVLSNLVGNALKFTGMGTVVVQVGCQRRDRPVVRVEVRDTGIGVAADARSRLFEPFVQIDQTDTRRFGGMGLGLAICKSLIELMGGRIGVESIPRKGSMFWFELPCDQPRDPRPTPDAHALVIGAPSENQTTLIEYLHEAGLEATVVGTIARAWEPEFLDQEYHAIFIDRPSLTPVVYELALELDLDLESELQFDPSLSEALRDRLATIDPGAAVVLLRDNDEHQGMDEYPGMFDRLPYPITHGSVMDCVHRLDDEGRNQRARTSEERWSARASKVTARVLVAEDNEINQKIIERMLDSLGCDVDIVSNGAEAVRAVGLNRYDLVLMDIQMPITDGLEATQVIRDHTRAMTPRVPIVAITASVLDEERQQWLDLGLDDVIAKPMDLDTLRDLVHRCVAKAG